jgi:ribose transport system substrate-binding protein
MTNFLTHYHDVQGVMAVNDSMALGVVKALDAAGIEVVGFDNIPAVQPLVRSGRMLATVEQYGADMAALGINSARANSRAKSSPVGSRPRSS